MKRNLSGIYIFTKENGKRVPTCLEDAPVEDRKRWLGTLDREALVNTCMMLVDTLNEISGALDIKRDQIP